LQVARRAYESAADSSILTRPVESLDPFMVEHEFWDRARDICVAHQRQRAIVKNQPLTVDASYNGGMIFVREEIF
jgi:hypothetical protein